MNIKTVRSDNIYKKIMVSPIDKRDDIYRYEMMMPFEKKWACYHIPMKSPTPGGYDIIMANSMLGLMPPTKIDETQRSNIDTLASDEHWHACESSISKSLACFSAYNIDDGQRGTGRELCHALVQ